MKFDPYSWQEVKTNEQITCEKGRLQLRLSSPCPVYVSAQGYEALAEVGSQIDLEFAEEMKVRIQASEGVRAFRFVPESTSQEADGEVWTNIDQMPTESGAVAEVTRALRQLELERRSVLREIRAERASLEAARSIPGVENPPPASEEIEAEAEFEAEAEPEAVKPKGKGK